MYWKLWQNRLKRKTYFLYVCHRSPVASHGCSVTSVLHKHVNMQICCKASNPWGWNTEQTTHLFIGRRRLIVSCLRINFSPKFSCFVFSVSFEQIGVLQKRFKQLSHNEETLRWDTLVWFCAVMWIFLNCHIQVCVLCCFFKVNYFP